MAETTPFVPQVNDPDLVVALTRLLSIIGPLGRLNVADLVVPVVIMGDVVARTVQIQEPAFRSSDIFTAGIQTAQPAGTILADTGQLTEGTYDIQVHTGQWSTTAGQRAALEIRNAANTANLIQWEVFIGFLTSGGVPNLILNMALEFAANERFRVLQGASNAAGNFALAAILARRR